jgi:SAM-dependent methyltransferase
MVRDLPMTAASGARRLLARAGRRLARLDPDPPAEHADDQAINDRYVEEAPSAATAVGLFEGQWSSKLPIDAETGPIDLFHDERIVSCADALGGVAGDRVLELGPLEGAHSHLLRRELGAASVTAIEANSGAYLRCLVTKEVLGLDGVEFLLGDCRPYLDEATERFDLAVAVGVLYHFDDPVPVLANLARLTDRMIIWTHVHDGTIGGELAARFDAPVERSLDGVDYRLHPYRYEAALSWSGFCGGTRPTAAWIERDDLLAVIEHLGFEIRLRRDQDHPHGPTITLAIDRP